jgi:hypothetical protein
MKMKLIILIRLMMMKMNWKRRTKNFLVKWCSSFGKSAARLLRLTLPFVDGIFVFSLRSWMMCGVMTPLSTETRLSELSLNLFRTLLVWVTLNLDLIMIHVILSGPSGATLAKSWIHSVPSVCRTVHLRYRARIMSFINDTP